MSSNPTAVLVTLLAVGVGIGLPGSGLAQVHRCTDANGNTTFTDKRCRDINAVEASPTPAAGVVVKGLRAARCPRNLQDLIYEVTSAIDRRDANRLAALYHWPGMSSDQGYRIMERLSVIVERPLVDVSAVMPTSPEGVDGEYYPQTTVRQAPVGLRVEQTLANGSTPSRTYFGLRRNLDCLWISF